MKELFRKVGNRSSEFHPEVRRVRREGSYIYEEFMPTGGTDVKVDSEECHSAVKVGSIDREKRDVDMRQQIGVPWARQPYGIAEFDVNEKVNCNRLREPDKSEDKVEQANVVERARKRRRVYMGSTIQKPSVDQNGGGLGVPQCRRGGSTDREERDANARQRIVRPLAWQCDGTTEARLSWSHRSLALMEGERWSFFFSLFFFLPPSIDIARNRPLKAEIDRYHLISVDNGAEIAPIDQIAGGLCIGQLADR
ncbi:hypothetical protein B296_00011865 [Ensete ventricosum]|uniref:Uncharacterized protein n=1 Tax=Ensete ventricosum TaxID=4639 RepID=A0A427B9L8_ENSVE|nr:hypothetical protein B296_00011865 [Ensete ventricosum]